MIKHAIIDIAENINNIGNNKTITTASSKGNLTSFAVK